MILKKVCRKVQTIFSFSFNKILDDATKYKKALLYTESIPEIILLQIWKYIALQVQPVPFCNKLSNWIVTPYPLEFFRWNHPLEL